MHVILRIESATSGDRQMLVRAGQVLSVGRTEWADLSVPDDDGLADVHFEVACDGHGCRIRNLDSGYETLLNGEPIADSSARSGDRINAGNTTLVVEVEGLSLGDDSETGEDADAEAGNPSGYEHVAASTAAEICRHLDLDDEALALAGDDASPRDLVDRLIENEKYAEAIRFLSHALPKREAVWWAACCAAEVAAETRESEQAAVRAARNWAAAETEENRQAAGAAAEQAGLESAAGMAAMSAFWSGGSIVPENMPAVAPEQWMTARGVAGAVTLAAVANPQENPLEMFRKFLERGTSVAIGGDRWEESA